MDLSGRSRPERILRIRQSVRLRRRMPMDNEYCYPDSSILRNELNIHDKDRLCQAEIRLVSIRLYQPYEKPIQGGS